MFWSRNSVGSDWVRAEAAYALRKDKLVPLLIDDADPPVRFIHIQTIDLSAWTGETRAEPFERLVGDLRHYFGQPTSKKAEQQAQPTPTADVGGALEAQAAERADLVAENQNGQDKVASPLVSETVDPSVPKKAEQRLEPNPTVVAAQSQSPTPIGDGSRASDVQIGTEKTAAAGHDLAKKWHQQAKPARTILVTAIMVAGVLGMVLLDKTHQATTPQPPTSVASPKPPTSAEDANAAEAAYNRADYTAALVAVRRVSTRPRHLGWKGFTISGRIVIDFYRQGA
jgi:TIR domain